MAIHEVLNEHERIAILKALAAMAGYSSNDSIIQSVCSEFGNDMSRDKVKVQLAWLAEQGAVTNQKVGAYTIATLTARGQDIAIGRAFVPGIKRPSA
ncbi:VpaChn25_0724 family phage protein [Agarivorans sp. QJM3NY_25]|uniref:VpaChn25_0724 family phage protein n=1 Tax=Agarivorans sp. QJM3NY_25 TaxID=3421430 RepID=UPI003D7D1E09